MITTDYGPHNGETWEELCQLVFKKKYADDFYQEMKATPGDFGIEGYTNDTGHAFQCYCPEKLYTREELYKKVRNKIRDDLKKLRKYEAQIVARIGDVKIRRWIFVTPDISKNDLLAYAKRKEREVRGWKLSFITNDFTIIIRDGSDYHTEINDIRRSNGSHLIIEKPNDGILDNPPTQSEWEENIKRKSSMRVASTVSQEARERKLERLISKTREEFLASDGYFRKISSDHPAVYFDLTRIIKEFEQKAQDYSLTWNGEANELTQKIQEELKSIVNSSLAPNLDETEAAKVSRLMTARWIAICQLDYE